MRQITILSLVAGMLMITTTAIRADDTPTPGPVKAESGQTEAGKAAKHNPVQHMLSKFDKNGDGILQPDEVAAMVAARNKRIAEKTDGKVAPKLTADDLMKKFDTNGDGSLDSKELQTMAREQQARHHGAHKKPATPPAST